MEYAKPFLLGGTIVAGSKLLSTMVDPAYASMVAGMPIGILASLFLKNDSDKRQYYKGYGITDATDALIVNIIALLSVRLPNIPVNTLSAVGYVLWLMLGFIGIKTFAIKKL